MVPAGCRSPGRRSANHSHQPDGVSVGERGKDGSGSVLPGPAGPRNTSGPTERRSGPTGEEEEEEPGGEAALDSFLAYRRGRYFTLEKRPFALRYIFCFFNDVTARKTP